MCCFLVQRSALHTHTRARARCLPPFIFFSPFGMEAVCPRARSKHVHRLAYIEGTIWESLEKVFVLSYIITFLRRIGIFTSWNEISIDSYFYYIPYSQCAGMSSLRKKYIIIWNYVFWWRTLFTLFDTMFHVGGTYLRGCKIRVAFFIAWKVLATLRSIRHMCTYKKTSILQIFKHDVIIAS